MKLARWLTYSPSRDRSKIIRMGCCCHANLSSFATNRGSTCSTSTWKTSTNRCISINLPNVRNGMDYSIWMRPKSVACPPAISRHTWNGCSTKSPMTRSAWSSTWTSSAIACSGRHCFVIKMLRRNELSRRNELRNVHCVQLASICGNRGPFA